MPSPATRRRNPFIAVLAHLGELGLHEDDLARMRYTTRALDRHTVGGDVLSREAAAAALLLLAELPTLRDAAMKVRMYGELTRALRSLRLLGVLRVGRRGGSTGEELFTAARQRVPADDEGEGEAGGEPADDEDDGREAAGGEGHERFFTGHRK